MKGTLGRLSAQLPLLADLSRRFADLPQVVDAIKGAIDQRGHVMDSASPALGRIRREGQIAHDRLVQKLNSLIQTADNREVLFRSQ